MTTSIRLNYIKSGFLYHFTDFNELEYYFFCSQHPKAADLLSRSIDVLLANGVRLLAFDSTFQIGGQTVQILYDHQSRQWISYHELDPLHYFPFYGLIANSKEDLVEHLNYAYVKTLQESNARLEKCKLFASIKRFDGVMF